MDLFHVKRVTDPVHGTFGISQLEADILSTRVFQRLHNVKQLGMANLVYPGAGYSRFAHSLGASHLAGKMLRAINQHSGPIATEQETQLYRLAALVHDIGHYPFSHAMEHVIENYYKADTFLGTGGNPAIAGEPASYNHETLGRYIIENDPEIGRVLVKHGYEAAELKAVFSKESPTPLSNLVSSDFDCDRLDYLMRTAHGAGIPYGGVDVEYLTSQTCLDSEGRLCLTRKALRAADHFLVSRYYDYTQVAFHKTVVGLEEALKDVVTGLIEGHRIDCSGSAMRRMVCDGSFSEFDDQWLVSRMRAAASDRFGNDIFRRKLAAVLERRAPKLVAQSETIEGRNPEQVRHHNNHIDQLRRGISEWARDFNIPVGLWCLWNRRLTLSKIGSIVQGDAGDDFEEEREQAIRVRSDDGTSKPLIQCGSALMRQLSNVRLYVVRLYVHLPDDANAPNLRENISERIRADLKYFPFTD